MGADPSGRTGPGLRSAHRHHPAAPAPWQAPGEPQQHPAPGAGPGLACKKAVSLQKSSIAPRGTVCPLWPGQTPGEISFRSAGEKKRRRSDRKSKRPRKKTEHGPERQPAGRHAEGAASFSAVAAAGGRQRSGTVDGRSSFFQIAAFLLREGGRVSPATLECRLACGPLALRRGVNALRFRRLCSKKLLYPVQLYGLL